MRGQTIEPVTPDELKFALGVCMAASAKKAPYVNPELYGMSLRDEETGKVHRLSLTDNAMARGALAVRAQFDNHDKCLALMLRISTVMRLLDDERMRPYVRGVGEPLEIREEVLDVAAVEELAFGEDFDAGSFFRNVEQRVNATRQ